MADKKTLEGKYDVIIIGGGPGGLTAGLYTARASFKTLLVESGMVMSQITVTHLVENYPGVPDIGGYELVEKFKEQAKKFGLATTYASVTGLEKTEIAGMAGWRVKTDAGDFEALSVIVATGANWRKIGVPGEAELTGRGVSYCATCDGPFYRDREVIVIGGGDTAVQEALFLTNFASKVTIVHRRDRLRATPILRERAAANPKIAFAWDSVVTRDRRHGGGYPREDRKRKRHETDPGHPRRRCIRFHRFGPEHGVHERRGEARPGRLHCCGPGHENLGARDLRLRRLYRKAPAAGRDGLRRRRYGSLLGTAPCRGAEGRGVRGR